MSLKMSFPCLRGAFLAGSLLVADLLCAESPEALTLPIGVVEVPLTEAGETAMISQGGLVPPRVFEGGGAVPAATTLTANAPGWTPGVYAGTHYVQLESGAWAAITANTADTLTLERPLPLTGASVFKIHPLQTLDGLFGGDNTAGFIEGADLSSADIVALWDSTVQNYAGFYYYNSTRQRWEDAANQPAGGTILYPDEGMLVISAGSGSIRLSGEVQLGSTTGAIAGQGGMSIVPNPYPVPLVLKDAGFENALSGGATFGEADWLLVWDNALQSFSAYFYYDTDDNTWKDAGNNPATATDAVPPAASIAVIKNSSGSADWTMAQPFALPPLL